MRIFVPEPLQKQLLFQWFYFHFQPERKIEGLFKDNLPPNFFQENTQFVPLEEAEVLVLPNNFTFLDEETRVYIKKYADEAQSRGIPIYIFSCADLTDSLVFDLRVKVFRYSIYRSEARPQDISMPTLTEDIGHNGITLRTKEDLPTISFCGKADFSSPREKYASLARRIKFSLLSIFNPLTKARIRGIFWRRWAIAACRRSPLIKTLFVLRKSFSGAMTTIEVLPEKAREEFIGSIENSDFVLAPKGDGNYSNRFLEALAMGRIPVLIDTDAVLPLENVIPYEKIVVRVPMNKVRDIPKLVRAFYDPLSHEEWQKRQRLARDTFEKHLRQDMFFKTFFTS